MKRKIVYHCGPTNSGKTYNALQNFMEAKKGVYCSPLRLLAMEVFDKVNSLGVYCSLYTGQEKKIVPFSNHVACTIEMVSTDELYDVAVIDEVQMMADSTRGYSWTKALLGLKADELHLCGDPSVLKIVSKICKKTGDELHVQQYDRFKPLVVEAKTLLGDFKNVQSGDCIVAFSRREIFEVKLAIEKLTKHKCCVIYGALPPETRRQQANLFNDQDTEYDVMVASDAVGMGLNLNIRRVVFHSLSKYNGDKLLPVSASQVKQIAGRAGRRGSLYPDGLVTTFVLDDLNYLIECMKQSFTEVTKVGLFPAFEQIELFAAQYSDITFFRLLDMFRETCRLDGDYFLCQHENVKRVANMLEKVKDLSLQERYNFCFAPVNVRDQKAMYHLLRFAGHYSQHRPVGLAMGLPRGSATNDKELLDLETKHQVLSMYLWLSHQFKKEIFPQARKAEEMAVSIADLLGKSLAKVCWKPESRSQGPGRRRRPARRPPPTSCPEAAEPSGGTLTLGQSPAEPRRTLRGDGSDILALSPSRFLEEIGGAALCLVLRPVMVCNWSFAEEVMSPVLALIHALSSYTRFNDGSDILALSPSRFLEEIGGVALCLVLRPVMVCDWSFAEEVMSPVLALIHALSSSTRSRPVSLSSPTCGLVSCGLVAYPLRSPVRPWLCGLQLCLRFSSPSLWFHPLQASYSPPSLCFVGPTPLLTAAGSPPLFAVSSSRVSPSRSSSYSRPLSPSRSSSYSRPLFSSRSSSSLWPLSLRVCLGQLWRLEKFFSSRQSCYWVCLGQLLTEIAFQKPAPGAVLRKPPPPPPPPPPPAFSFFANRVLFPWFNSRRVPPDLSQNLARHRSLAKSSATPISASHDGDAASLPILEILLRRRRRRVPPDLSFSRRRVSLSAHTSVDDGVYSFCISVRPSLFSFPDEDQLVFLPASA
ncbi:hypothetical protein KSP40_PGU016523 [Platanthera guangdongensis]|uniref:RNA helicase n=1 Tax=Platanthera guangdongensis TaxID=2320717 RepID=A0ABR2LRV2_9ASPA